MNEKSKEVVEMILYYVLASCEKQDLEQCKEVINLQYDMLTNGGKDDFLDSLIDTFPKDHIVQEKYQEICKNGVDEAITAYDGAISAFSKADKIDFSKLEDDEDVEKLAKELMSL